MLRNIVIASGIPRRAAWIRDKAGDVRWQVGRRALRGIRSMQNSQRLNDLAAIPKLGKVDVGNILSVGVQLGLKGLAIVVDELRS